MARLGGRALALAPRMAGAGACRTSSSATAAPHPSGLQKMAAQGPQSEMRFSLDATQLQVRSVLLAWPACRQAALVHCS